MKSIIFFETRKSGSSRAGINAAKKIGYKVHLFTSNKKFLEEKGDFIEVDEFHLVNFNDINQVRETVEKIQLKEPVACLISFIDSYVSLAANLSNELCGTNLSVNAFKLMEDKLLTREQLANYPYSPFFYVLSKEDPIKPFINKVKHQLPLVVKLPKSSGSKNVYLVQTVVQLKNRLRFLRNHYNDDLLIEEYLDGPQFIVEAIVHEGKVLIAAIVEQEITINEKLIVTGYSVSNELDNASKKSLLFSVNEMIQILGLENGNCHLEIRNVQNVWKLVEANPRISGGVMNELIQEAYGFNYAEQILNTYLGNSPTLLKVKEDIVYAHYLTVDIFGKLIKVTGKQSALETNGVLKVYIKPQKGDFLTPPLSLGKRYGFVLAKGKTKDEARSNAQNAASEINFRLIPL